MTIHIKIGEIETFRTENWQVVLNGRQERVETIGGIVVQDFGIVEGDEIYSCSATLKAADAQTLNQYWHNRTLVTVRDVAGIEIHNMRVIVKKYNYVNRFEDYYAVDLEFWRE